MSCRKNFDRQMSKSGCCNNSKDVDYSGDVLLVNKIMLLTKKISAFFFFFFGWNYAFPFICIGIEIGLIYTRLVMTDEGHVIRLIM